MSRADSAGDAYEELCGRYERILNLESAGGVLGWDQRVMMPDAGAPARSAQLSTLSALTHEYLTDERTCELLDQLDGDDLGDERAAVVRAIRHDHERAIEMSEELVERLTRTQSKAQQVWAEARANDDFEQFAPMLAQVRDLHVERAEQVAPDRSPYEVMHEDGEPDIPLEAVEEIFETLREELLPLIEEIRERGDDLPTPFVDRAPYDADEQMTLSETTLDLLEYDWDRGRLDTATHPFVAGNQFDARVTTRFDEDDLLGSVTSTVHEFGHATYQLGLPQEHYGSPLGQALSTGVDESQSRFWENHVVRTEAFWEYYLPTVHEQFPETDDVGVREAYEAANRIYPDNLIRTEADELTYHFHVMLRYEIGQAFVEGDLDVEEIPRVWNDKMEEYLGVRPDTDAQGCLQDNHWSSSFAAFQGYTIGSVLAAQLDAAMRDDLDEDVDDLIRRGEFEPLREWMTEHVHRHGRRYPADELIEQATGEPLTAEYFVDYAKEKFTELYGL